ncbi:hypothetical protein F2P81_002956 [Scophthalmus maximus]|uniref:Uncharacterized protein n=1 Tax=Scophthalmus maximus TaxID=52904 RepID=A0A6A4TH67_SCOMX|nr:hypothetical protein F2P81_002956 [Scophthalmus maximus]
MIDATSVWTKPYSRNVSDERRDPSEHIPFRLIIREGDVRAPSPTPCRLGDLDARVHVEKGDLKRHHSFITGKQIDCRYVVFRDGDLLTDCNADGRGGRERGRDLRPRGLAN